MASRLALFSEAILQALKNTDATKPPLLAVAYSGGADSTVLLHALAHLHQNGRVRGMALHVHHGLSPNADRWLAHCAQECAALNLPFFAEHVNLHLKGGQSLEAEARQARYAALQRLCLEHQVQVLMTAHHADDQAETVLLNLLRGTGIAGLSGAARQRTLNPDQPNEGALILLRPLLEFSAQEIRQLAQDSHWSFIEDESNQDKRHTRNALRHEIMPLLKRIFPTASARLAQTAAHSAEAQALLDDIGQEDLAQLHLSSEDHGSDLNIDGLRSLSRPRAANALRVWFRRQSMRAPSTAALNEMLNQLLESRSDAQISLLHEDLTLRVYRGRVYARPVIQGDAEHDPLQAPSSQALLWNGESQIRLPDWHGQLIFETGVALGIQASLLRSLALTVRARQGGERLKLYAGRPSRSLKNLYQERAIPPWQRARLPLIFLGYQLIFAAELGMDVRHINAPGTTETTSTEARVALHWQPD